MKPIRRKSRLLITNPKTASMNTFLKIALLTLPLSLTVVHAADATLEASAKEAGAVVTASGLVYKSLKDGAGASPKASDTVKVNYRGTFPDGKEFDSSYKRNQAIEFPLGGVIPCLDSVL